MNQKTALIVEGGAMRGIFAAGVLDSFINNQFNPFDLYLGVSSGANNLTAYLSNMYQKTYAIYTDYMLRKKFINWGRFLTGGHLIDLDWLWEITRKELFTQDITINNEVNFYVVLTKVATGEPIYIKPHNNNLYQVLKAACAVPFIYRHFPKYNEEEMTDGGVSDPLPVQQAHKLGAKKIVIIRSRSSCACLNDRIETILCGFIFRKYRNLAQKLAQYYYNYNKSLEFINNPPKGVEVISIMPPNKCCVTALTTTKKKIENDYKIGRIVGNQFMEEYGEELIQSLK